MHTETIKGKAAQDSLTEDYINHALHFGYIKRMSTHFKSVTHTTITVYYDNDTKAIYTNIN